MQSDMCEATELSPQSAGATVKCGPTGLRDPASTKWDVMQKDICDANEESPQAACLAMKCGPVGLRDSPKAGSALPQPAAAGWRAHMSGWCTSNSSPDWLFEPAERVYYHVPTDTLWARDPLRGPSRESLVRLDLQTQAIGGLAWARSGMELLRACLLSWRHACAPHKPIASRAAEVAATLWALHRGGDGDAVAPRVVLGMLELHRLLSAEWQATLKARSAEASVGTDDSAVSYFKERLSSSVRGLPGASALKAEIAHGIAFRRLRGALSLGAELWSAAYDRTSGPQFLAAARMALCVLFTLDELTHALPGEIPEEECTERFGIREYADAEALPPGLHAALRQLGPLS